MKDCYMSRNPAFLFYDADAARDTSHMNRLQRGGYFDLIQTQVKFHGFTLEQARMVLGKDFDECWNVIKLVLKQNGDMFYFEWVKESLEKREKNSSMQQKRIQEYWDKKRNIPRNNDGMSTDIPYATETETETETVIRKRKKNTAKEKVFVAPTFEELCAYCKGNKIDMTEIELKYYLETRTGNNWIRRDGHKVKVWKLDIKQWYLGRQIQKQDKQSLFIPNNKPAIMDGF